MESSNDSQARLFALIDAFHTSRRTVVKAGVAAAGMGVAGVALAGRASAQSAPNGTPPAGGPGGAGQPGGTETLDAFVGVTTDGNVIADLFPIQSTGASTEAVRQAAEEFLASLADDQRALTEFAVDDDEWRKWSNIDSYQRQGISLREMSDAQKSAAMSLLEASLSASGYDKTGNTMKLNHTEGELMNNLDGFDEDLYWFTVMGEPSGTEPWGWQIDGHHLVINYFVLGDQVVATPFFMGAEPTIAPEGTKYAGLSILQDEQDNGLTFVNSLTSDQQAKAVISTDKSGEDMRAGAFSDNAQVPYAGIQGKELTADQQTALLALIEEYTGNIDDARAAIKMADVKTHIDDTWFTWIGKTSADAVFYYRIQSPVVMIEFDHQSPGPLGRSSNYYNGPQRAHVHTIVRTPNGNDYGKDLLAEHYATGDHHAATPAATASS